MEGREALRVTLASIGDAVMTTDTQGRIVSLNRVAESLTGWTHAEASGRPIETVFHIVHEHTGRLAMDPASRALEEGAVAGLASHTVLTARDGTERSIEDIASPIRDAQGDVVGMVLVFRDETERKRADERIQYLAHHDELTGLPNRALLQDRIEQAMAHAHRSAGILALLFIDLDRFKTINDSLGHLVGDQLLRQVAERLQHCVRQVDTLARLGGDEFVIVLGDIADAEDAARVAYKIMASVTQPYSVGSRVLDTSCSIGISMYPTDGRDAQTLMRKADMAMYHAKDEGRNNYQFYSDYMNTKEAERLGLENALRRGLERSEFLLHYQPIVDLTTNKIVSLEVLLRWRHPEMGLIPPSKFIPVAEDTGMIVPIGDWVLETACKQARTWLDRGLPPVRLAINLSAAQFNQHDLATQVAIVLSNSGLDAACLQLEITEGMTMREPDRTGKALADLRAMGIVLIIDDFGTGYSSLSYLKRLPIGGLKIDRSFVDGVPGDANDSALTRAIIAMADSLGLRVIAEGVETPMQHRFLKEAGCQEFQGYLFSQPRSPTDIEALLRRHASHGEQVH